MKDGRCSLPSDPASVFITFSGEKSVEINCEGRIKGRRNRMASWII